MSQNNRFVCLVNLGFPKHFHQKWRSIDKEDSWEATDGVPNVGGNGLNGSDDDDVLLLTFEVLGSQWQNEMHNGAVNAAYHDMILQLLK